MNFVWEWPQITWIVLASIGLFWHALRDGEPRTDKHSLSLSMLSLFLSFGLLYFGGFFTVVRP